MISFEQFCANELPRLAGYARLLVRDKFAAEDLLQDALMAAHQRWNRIGAMDQPGAYVRRIITTRNIDHGRRWAVRAVALTATGELPERAAPDEVGAVLDRDVLVALLDRLRPRERAAVVLRHYLGLGDQEIAEELGLAVSTVRSMISRALAGLRATAHPADPPDSVAFPDPAPVSSEEVNR